MKTKQTKQPKIVTVASVGMDAQECARGVLQAFEGKDAANAEAGKFYAQGAARLDSIAPTWVAVDMNGKTPETVRAKFAECGIEPAEQAAILAWIEPFKAAIKAVRPKDSGQAMQGLRRAAREYNGSKPTHPEAVARAEQAKADKATKEAVTGKEEKEAPATVSVADLVARDPNQGRVLISQVIAGLLVNKGLRAKNKISVKEIENVIEACQEACEAFAAMKAA